MAVPPLPNGAKVPARWRLARPAPDDAALIVFMTLAFSRQPGRWPVPFTSAMAEAEGKSVQTAGSQGAALATLLLSDCRISGSIAVGWLGVSPPRCAGLNCWLREAHQGHGLLHAFAQGGRSARTSARLCVQTALPVSAGSSRVLAAYGPQSVRLTLMDSKIPARHGQGVARKRIRSPLNT